MHTPNDISPAMSQQPPVTLGSNIGSNKPFMVDGTGANYVLKKLKSGDYTIRPITVKKTWEFTTNTSSINYYGNHKIEPYRFLYPENHKYFGNVVNISSSLYQRPFLSQSLDPKLLWYYLDHNYYTDYNKTDKVSSYVLDYTLEKSLSESGSMLVIPRSCIGEGIYKKSIEIKHMNITTSSLNYTLVDDGYGNMLDTSIDPTKIIDRNNLIFYVGFNEKYRERDFRKKRSNYVIDYSIRENTVKIVSSSFKTISYSAGIPLNDVSASSGISVNLTGSYFYVQEKNRFNFGRNENFAFSFWLNFPVSQSDTTATYNNLFTKNYVTYKDYLQQGSKVDNPFDIFEITSDGVNVKNKVETFEVKKSINQYPFDITLTNYTHEEPNKIIFKQKSLNRINEVSSSALTPNSWHHVVCQKSASCLQIWIDGTLNISQDLPVLSGTRNDSNFYIAGNGTTSSSYHGVLDEIRVYNKFLNSNDVANLYDNDYQYGYAYQSRRVGNVFYNEGIITISDPRPKYNNALLGRNGNFDYHTTDYGFEGKFKSQVTFYEHEIICKIRRHEFNFTQNPSIRKDKDSDSHLIEDYVTGSYFNPYITTIGLYNDEQELVAIAKLANPTAKRDDVDMNFIVRFDI